LRDLADAGIDIIEQQGAWEWKEYQITGHIDGTYVEDGVAVPVEIKSMHPAIYDTVFCFDDFKKKPWTRVYMAQIVLYMLSKNIDKGIFILKNKSTGELKQLTVDLDYELGEAILKAAETINTHIANETLPDKIPDREVCKKCPFKLVCLPEINFGVELKIQDNPAFESKVDRYLSIKETQKEAGDLWDEIRNYGKATAENGELNIICGKYKIVGTTNGRGFSMKIDKI
jgi:CRISPR/Cas system-associated exonuclease Cas4 (RecB family)